MIAHGPAIRGRPFGRDARSGLLLLAGKLGVMAIPVFERDPRFEFPGACNRPQPPSYEARISLMARIT